MHALPLSVYRVIHRCSVTSFYLLLISVFQPLVSSAQFLSDSQQKLFDNYKSTRSATPGNPYWVVAFDAAGTEGIKCYSVVRQLGKGVAIVRMDSTYKTLSKENGILAIAPAGDEWKCSPNLQLQLQAYAAGQKGKTFFTIIATQLDTLFASLRKKNVTFEVVSIFSEIQAATILCNGAVFTKDCLPDAALVFADLTEIPKPDIMVPGYRRNINQVQLTSFIFPTADGHGISIGIKENRPQEIDPDLQKRIASSPIASATADNHATTIATLAGGAGNSDYSGKGTASRCRFFPSSFGNLFADSSGLLRQNNVSVQNHSYGTVIQPFYGAEAVSYDVQAMQIPTLLSIFSSGNLGTASTTTGTYAGISGFANLTGNFKMAKNIVTVAATDTGGQRTAFSSAGPLYDGRLAPQLTTLGPNGTSEAAAIVSGAVAVLQQIYKDSNASALPPPSLVKAILYTSCDDIGPQGIDYQSGYGLLNVYAAIRCLQQRRYDGSTLVQGQVWTKNIPLPANTANLKITLCWTDTAAQVNNSTALVNDLDITLTETSNGTVYRPWVLSSFASADSLRKLPVRRRDSLNTSEQISIALPSAGTWQLQVSGRKISTIQPQAFHVAYTWDTLNLLNFTNPVPPLENEQLSGGTIDIRWTVALADTNATGILSVSYNNGISWQTIGSGIALKKKLYYWQLPDTTAQAQLRMNSPFGNFFSSRFLLAPATSLRVDYLCRDSLRLSWNTNRLANAYTLFTLGDTAYLKPLLTLTDTFVVLNRNFYPNTVYAVQPLTSNAPTTTRSLAIDVNRQGSNCFYNTFYAQPATDSILLTLEAGFTAGLDSIIFEKVTAGGTLIRTLAIVPGSAATSYTIRDAVPMTGANYYRAKMKRGSQFFYTEIISVIHSGTASVFVYPNPVRRGQPLNILLKETIGKGRLQLYDVTGRLLKQFSIEGNTRHFVSDLPEGIYVYRVWNADNAIVGSGKIMVQ